VKLNAWDSLIFEGIAENGYIKPRILRLLASLPSHYKDASSILRPELYARRISSNQRPKLRLPLTGLRSIRIHNRPSNRVLTHIHSLYHCALLGCYRPHRNWGIHGASTAKQSGCTSGRVFKPSCHSVLQPNVYAASLSYFECGWGCRSSISRMLKIYLLPLMSLLGVVLWYRQVHGAFYYFTLEHDICGVSFATPIQQAQWILNTKGTGWFTSQNWSVLGLRLTPTYWYVRNTIFEAFYFIDIALLIWRTSHPARLFLAFYSATVEVPLLFIVGTPAISNPRLLLPAYPAIYGYAATINKQWVKVYLALCIVSTIWVSLSQAYAFFS
jgi:hypothetical protein